MLYELDVQVRMRSGSFTSISQVWIRMKGSARWDLSRNVGLAVGGWTGPAIPLEQGCIFLTPKAVLDPLAARCLTQSYVAKKNVTVPIANIGFVCCVTLTGQWIDIGAIP